MVLGKNIHHSPIISAIAEASRLAHVEIRIHLSQRWFEIDPFRRAAQLFEQFNLSKNDKQQAVLLYFNIRKRKFAVIGSKPIHEKLGPQGWKKLESIVKQNLNSTQTERAIALTIKEMGILLNSH